MRSKFISSLLVSCCLVGLSGVSSYAQEPELAFYSTNSWHVQSGATCTLSSVFNNSFVLTLNGGREGVDVLSVDFKQNAFESGKGYPVALSVPGLARVSEKGTAQNGQVLTVPLKGQNKLYTSMRDSAVLDMEVDGNRFRFYLVGINEGTPGFELCMADQSFDGFSNPMAKTAPVSQPDSTAPQEIVVSTKTMNDTDSSYTKMTKRLSKPVVDTASSAPSREPYDRFIDRMEKKPEQIAPVPYEPVIAETAPMPEPIIGAPQSLIAEKPVEEPHPAPEIQSVAPDIKYVMKGNDKSNLEHLGIPENSSIPVTRENYEIKADFVQMDEIQTLRAKNKSLRNELELALQESRQESMSIEGNNWDLERATMLYNEAERQVQILGQKLQRERTSCQMEKRELETMLFDPQVTNEQQLARLADLEEQLATAQQELQMQRMRYDQRIQVLEGR